MAKKQPVVDTSKGTPANGKTAEKWPAKPKVETPPEAPPENNPAILDALNKAVGAEPAVEVDEENPEIVKLDPKVKKKWLEELRSGKYKQATGTLRATDAKGNVKGFCCLGVLCDIFSRSKANVEKTKWVNKTMYVTTDLLGQNVKEVPNGETLFGDYESVPNEKVAAWSGLYSEVEESSNPSVLPIKPIWAQPKLREKLKKAKIKMRGEAGDGLIDLASLNDAGFSFKQIADIIEEYL